MLVSSNPKLYALLQTRRQLRLTSARELECATRLRRDGPSWRLAMMQLADVTDDPETARLRTQLEEFDHMTLYSQRDLLTRVEQYVAETMRTRRATAFLHLMATAMPGCLTPLRILLPMAMVFSMLTVVTLVVGEVEIAPMALAALVLGPLVVLPIICSLFHGSRLRGWFRDEFMVLAQQRGIEIVPLIRMLEVAERGKSRVDSDVRMLARERWTLIALLRDGEVAMQTMPMDAEAPPVFVDASAA